MLKVDEWRFFSPFSEKWNGNFFIFFHRHTAKKQHHTYVHVFLLTLREVMNNFEARGLHFLLRRCPRQKISEGRTNGRAMYKIGFSLFLSDSDKRFFPPLFFLPRRKKALFSPSHDMIKWQNFLILQKHENQKHTRVACERD
jgi:hypothetical protein